MGEARWLPLFVTADISTNIMNSILKSAAAEKEEDEDFENRWCLIHHASQQVVTKPTVAPISPFQGGFIDASLETLQRFLVNRCGENGLGHDSGIYMDWLANDAFGVIDARTTEDDTILFCVEEIVDAIQEAEVRVAWDKGTKSDVLLLKYIENAAEMDDRDVLVLAENVVNDNDDLTETTITDLGADEAKQMINDWIDSEQQGGRPKWFEIRMIVENAMKNSYGIWNIGPAAVLTEMKDHFDEHGVMRY